MPGPKAPGLGEFECTFFIDICRRKNGQKQVQKKAFKINAKIEDVGLNED